MGTHCYLCSNAVNLKLFPNRKFKFFLRDSVVDYHGKELGLPGLMS